MDAQRRNITLTISGTSYRRARIYAAKHNLSLSKLVEVILSTIDISKNVLDSIGYTGSQAELERRLDEGK